jgi:hypothetical protein
LLGRGDGFAERILNLTLLSPYSREKHPAEPVQFVFEPAALGGQASEKHESKGKPEQGISSRLQNSVLPAFYLLKDRRFALCNPSWSYEMYLL